MRTRERQLRTFSSKHPVAFLCLTWVVGVVFETESLAWVRLAFWSSCPRLLIGRLWPWTNVYSCKSCFCVMRTVSLTPRAPPIICIFMCKYRKNSGIVFFHSVKNDTKQREKGNRANMKFISTRGLQKAQLSKLSSLRRSEDHFRTRRCSRDHIHSINL